MLDEKRLHLLQCFRIRFNKYIHRWTHKFLDVLCNCFTLTDVKLSFNKRSFSDLSFFSSSEATITDRYIFVETELSWSDAQLYCRKRYTDLASVRNEEENQEIQLLAKNRSVWIGLYRSGKCLFV